MSIHQRLEFSLYEGGHFLTLSLVEIEPCSRKKKFAKERRKGAKGRETGSICISEEHIVGEPTIMPEAEAIHNPINR